ncbi:MAG: hypothetical protein M5U14_20545 [Acidimicrobiia bacterium]|nr:hypothetical protein [Acidimicrobiia bacterium]
MGHSKSRRSRSRRPGSSSPDQFPWYGISHECAAVSSHTQAPPLHSRAFGRAWQYVHPPIRRSGTFQENQHVSVSHQRSDITSSWKSSSAPVKIG